MSDPGGTEGRCAMTGMWSATSPASVGSRWHGRIWCQPEGRRVPVIDACPHEHLKRAAAQRCGDRAAARVNRLARQPGHSAWPLEITVRNAQDHPVGRVYNFARLPERVFPLTAVCYTCGQPVHCAAPGATWEHDIKGEGS